LAADEKRQWLVKNPKGFGMGEERREEVLRIGHGGTAAAAAAADKKKQKDATKNKVVKKRNAKRTFDPDAETDKKTN
jgi:shikimate 5-dehydrogenase